ncbi:MAG: Gfo/Idh/MocA family oxidoreductase [Planctomycetota bacterium]|nr:Gfo/Idh/MocA family oxidoreductase [Planctomycetota bacterium]
MASGHADENNSPIRVGFVGLDSSHCIAFTELLHREGNTGDLAGIRIVAAYPGGNPEFPLSRDRVQGYTEKMKSLGVEIVDSIELLLPMVDVVILGSVDGRQHLEQVAPVLKAGKPVFIDKPLAHNLEDALRILELGRKYNTPWFTASALRYQKELQEFIHSDDLGEVVGCDSFGQSRAGIGHADLAWYGVHGIETLYIVMGPGCLSVTRLQTDKSEQVTGLWEHGRIGTYRGIREHTHKTGFGASIFGTKSQRQISIPADYEGLVVEIAKFFKTRQPPIDEAVMIEIFAFIEAADESKRQGGIPVTLASVMNTARQSIDTSR